MIVVLISKTVYPVVKVKARFQKMRCLVVVVEVAGERLQNTRSYSMQIGNFDRS
jgi:hypothetical protein